MTQPARKKPGPKPKPKPVDDAAMDALEAERAAIAEQAAEPAPVEPVDARDDHDEPATDPEPAAVHMPLIDGADPAWAISASVGSRHIQLVARDEVKHADVVSMLAANTVTIPGHNRPTLIASRSITPPALRPVRITFTVRERIEQ